MATIPTSECLTDGCTAPRHARGWCANHYAYFRSRGEVAAFDEWTPRGGTCEVDGCGRKHYARGWCRAHYQQWYHGEEVRPLTRARDRTLRQRIEQRIIIAESGCWEWQGAVGPTGTFTGTANSIPCTDSRISSTSVPSRPATTCITSATTVGAATRIT
jgi:hypothetical protein